jgi:iron(III) transport system substrate-binding protein
MSNTTLFSALSLAVLASTLPLSATAQPSAPVSILCSAGVDWCQHLTRLYQTQTGQTVQMATKSTGEVLAQLNAEKGNPKTDLWFGGTGDPHLQAAEIGLLAEYKSDRLPTLHTWAQNQAAAAKYQTVGIYLGPMAFSYNTELLARKKLPLPACWKDLVRPEFKGEVQMANPASSGTAYTAIATLVQLMGEEPAFAYLKQLHGNISQYPRSGSAPLKNAMRGENTVGISFLADIVGEMSAGSFPLKYTVPCEGTGYEIGSMSIVKGARNPEGAKKFYEWALTEAAQNSGLDVKSFQIPALVAGKVHPMMPKPSELKLINYDFVKFGAAATRNRLLQRWQQEVNK